MRTIEHILYTPAPDIVHEAAGHAPIIADETYAEYLQKFGEYGSKAMASKVDFEVYEAIRHEQDSIRSSTFIPLTLVDS
jgi:phenylalanine-4-hydroxylase